MIRSQLFVTALIATSGCSSPSLPLSTRFPAIEDRPPAARVFVDANGTFYPDGWRDYLDVRTVKKSHSLLSASNLDQRRWLGKQEEQRLEALRTMFAGKQRIFVLVHGYNIGEADAALAFDMIERRIAFRPDDAVLHLHWDGRLGSGIGMVTIWFRATGYSQVVGIRGLRRILGLPRNQDVHVISHSRGASVVLSALGDPPFAPDFRRRTEALPFSGPSFLGPPITENGNRIHAILLAPAVGYPDFWDRSCEGSTERGDVGCSDPPIRPAPSGRQCPEYRVFTPQLKSIRYTVNTGDHTLRKYALNLRRYFNATDLGFDYKVGERLKACFPFNMKEYPIGKPHRHAFSLYAQDPELAVMLRDDGVDAR